MIRLYSKNVFLLILLSLISCRTSTSVVSSNTEEKAKHFAAYDSTTLENNLLPVMMPYNRIINPAGKVISYGSPDLENHTLDIQAIPNSNFLAIEDRYGIAILSSKTLEIVERWSYSDDRAYAGFVSTYSGIQVVQNGDAVEIFWSAANKGKRLSKVFKAIWNGKNAKIETTFDFKPSGDSPLALPNELAINTENGKQYLYVVLNGNNTLEKVDLQTKNWFGLHQQVWLLMVL